MNHYIESNLVYNICVSYIQRHYRKWSTNHLELTQHFSETHHVPFRLQISGVSEALIVFVKIGGPDTAVSSTKEYSHFPPQSIQHDDDNRIESIKTTSIGKC